MTWLRVFIHRLRGLFLKRKLEQELEDEIRTHLDMQIEDNLRRGMSSEEARYEALRKFGGVEQVKESYRDRRSLSVADSTLQDLRYALRILRRSPGFTLVAALLLALGIGANTAIFSVVDAVLLKMLPVREPERLVLLTHGGGRTQSDSFSYRNFEQFRDHDWTLSGVLSYYPLRLTVSVNGQPEPAINGQLVTGSYYSVLGVNTTLGRTIAPDDDRAPGAHPVCVISDGYWSRRFGRDPAVVGKTIHVSGFPFTIIGVTPPEFFGLEVGASMDITVPVMMQEQVMPEIRTSANSALDNRFRIMGRLRPGATMEQAQASLGLLYQQYIAERFERMSNSPKEKKPDSSMLKERLTVASGSKGLSALRRQFSQPLLIVMSVAALALLIACANVAGLMLARAVARRKEMAVRLALGSGRLRLVRQLLTESFLLAGLGGLLGLLFARWGTRLLLPLLSQGEIPIHHSFTPDLRILSFTAAVAALTGVLFGLTPAFVATRVDLQSALKQDSQGISGGVRLSSGRVFVVAQVALSLLLLVGAGLFVRSLQKLRQVDTGFARENALVLKLEPVGSDNKGRARSRLTALYDELLRRVVAMPGVQRASLVGYSPISRSEWGVMGQNPEFRGAISVEGYQPQSDEDMGIHWMQVYPNSFATLGIPLVSGRDFGAQDSLDAPKVAVINESMARRFFGNESPIGRRFGFGVTERRGEIEIIGMVKDAKYKSLREPNRPMFYLPFAQANTGRGQMTLIVRTAEDPALVAVATQREARALDPAMPMFEVETLATQLDASLAQERLVATLSSVFGLLALLLACIGLYGVMAYDVARRIHEIGIRMALGASARQVTQLVLLQTLWLVGIGIVIGLGAALAATRWVKSLLFGLQPHDPMTIGLAVLVLLAVAAVAGYLPARRATRVDPLVALKYE
jgi:predicted permease